MDYPEFPREILFKEVYRGHNFSADTIKDYAMDFGWENVVFDFDGYDECIVVSIKHPESDEHYQARVDNTIAKRIEFAKRKEQQINLKEAKEIQEYQRLHAKYGVK